ncbi:MAG: hypothetical protein QF923_02140 [Candidatus Marinimicrobia bacterium]|jgi:hypothetical protein|nr:hypothetical protein [Candidatus Neomarinimicrobiota bacterium]MDP7437546.1 hypothetical protein [Candidatus Neomarinimicrobiota bacterium]MDP7558256.1 hypothetical protein [Candidatus Neomarinimicrobiota bacterium]MDP7653603.1 hypothetical protein [Candidatus Neomarinimicrobiota bacterium]|tara:strand:- start:1189 stop:2061 length:873 start_codon:yes stop_codon:yes gene_type:complete
MNVINKKPFVGLLAFLVVLFTMPLGHTAMILMEKIFGSEFQYLAATILGLIGLVFLWIGTYRESETSTTWLGFFAGVFIWTGWVEFSFIYFAHHVNIAPLIDNGEVITKPEYLLMPSSIGLLLATGIYFFFNADTRCHFFRWFHRNMNMKLKNRISRKERNYSLITAIETIYIIWLFYIILLLIYDNQILGDRHPVTYIIFFGMLMWFLYLFVRLLKFQRMAPAVRYAIPTVIVFWNCVEILGRWNFFKEIWIAPQQYALEMMLIFGAFVGVTVLTILTPKREENYECTQ